MARCANSLLIMAALLAAARLHASEAPAAKAEGDVPELAPIDAAEKAKDLWLAMRGAYNRQVWTEVCNNLDALRRLGEDVNPSRVAAGYAYLRCARNKANAGDIDGAEEQLKLSVQFNGETKEHIKVRATLDRWRGLKALENRELSTALRLFELAHTRAPEPQAERKVIDALVGYGFQMHGRGDDVSALAAIDAALLFEPRNNQASVLRTEIWIHSYGRWIFLAVGIFLAAILVIVWQWRELKIRQSLSGFGRDF